MALFQCWNTNRFKNPFTITREEVMKLSAIGSKNTYHKSLWQLHDFGYIFYKASSNKFHKSSVNIVVFENSNPVNIQQLNLFVSPGSKNNKTLESTSPNSVQDEENPGIKIDTAPVPILTFASPKFDTVPVPYLGLLIKHKHINSKQERGKNSLTQILFSKNNHLQKGINQIAGRSNLGSNNIEFQKPSLETVLAFFSENNYPAPEAHKFFSHYQSNGWLVAGKTPMQDWKSSANKWMINTSNFQLPQKPNNGNHEERNIDTGPGKNYSQPL